MNRRGFFKTLAAATAGFTILPPSTTYQRIWKATRQINPAWLNAPYELVFRPLDYAGGWTFRLSTEEWIRMLESTKFPEVSTITELCQPRL